MNKETGRKIISLTLVSILMASSVTFASPVLGQTEIRLDKERYTWTDKVFITIEARDHNFDSNLIDEIGDTSIDKIVIATRGNKLNQYKLVETGTDTGIFTGEVILTGFNHDADGNINTGAVTTGFDTNPRTTPATGGGPTNGFLEADNDDGLTISFNVAADQTVVKSALIRWKIGEIQWDKANYSVTGGAVLNIADPDMNLNPEAVDSFKVSVRSDSDAGGIDLTVTETNEATGIFHGMVNFTATDESSGHRLRVAEGDTVTAKYEDNTLPSPYTTADELEVTATTFIGTIVQPPALPDKFNILFKSGAFTPDPGLNIDAIKGNRTSGVVHFLIQFTDLPNSAEKEDVETEGIHILDYVTGNTYIASATVANVDNLNNISKLVTWAGPFNVDYKITHDLKAKIIPTWATLPGSDKVVLTIFFHSDVNLKDAKALIDSLDGHWLATVRAIPSMTAAFDLDKINDIAQEDIVQYVDVTMPPLAAANNVARERAYVTPLAGPLYDLRGRGVTILIYDEGLVGGHDDFIGRLKENDTNTSQVWIAHSVLVGGIVGGSGSLSTGGQLAGMAPEINIRTFAPPTGSDKDFWHRPTDLEADVLTVRDRIDLATMSMAHNVHVMNDANACQYLGGYSEAAVLIDELVTGNVAQSLGRRLIFFEAVGNERINSSERCNTEYETISSPATAKNSIAVGAIKSDDAGSMSNVSSWGPTKDGRIKPDITAPGCRDDTKGPMSTNFNNRYDWSDCMTSYATPIASGATALLIEEWRRIPGHEPTPLPHTVKAILIHTATDRGNSGPDYQYGWGALNATSAINLVKANGNGPLIKVDQINLNGGIVSTAFTSDGSKKVKATLVWDDPPAAALQIHTLINDLDLELVAPSTTQPILPFILNPNSTTTPATRATPNNIDKTNNVEMVISDAPRNGIWTVNVKGTNVPVAPQQYTLIISDTIPEAGAITVVNTLPSITSTGPTTKVPPNTLYSYDVNADDPGDTLTFSLDTAPTGMIIDSASGLISWTPTASQVGSHSVTVRVTDSGGLSDTQSFTVSVGDCLIATATYGSAMAPQVQALRELRDGTVLKTTSGSAFMTGFNTIYYSFSPTIAEWENQNPIFKEAVKITITPLLSTLSILQYVDIDSEAKMLVYGISIILLNIGMYFVAPVFVIMRLRRK